MAACDRMVDLAGIEDVTVGFWSLGADTGTVGSARCCRRPGTTATGPANFLHRLRPADDVELDTTLDAGLAACRRIVLDGRPADPVVAGLVARDWRLHHHLQLVLPADRGVDADPAPLLDATVRDLAPADWFAIEEMLRVDHAEEDRRTGRAPRPAAHTTDALAMRHRIAAQADYVVVAHHDRPVAFACSWVNHDGLGIVEDVFVSPAHRRHGLATRLLIATVARARGHGAGEVVVAAEPDDTPKHLYRCLGFVPTAVLTSAEAPDDAHPEVREPG